MSGHTPGPWTVYTETPDGWRLVMASGPSGRIVANVNAESCPTTDSAPCFVIMPADANARLIAAAPDLLDALQSFIALVNESSGVAGFHVNGDVCDWDDLEVTEMARKAIAKATGSSVT